MANSHDLFEQFDTELNILPSKKKQMVTSKDNLRKKIKDDFKAKHPGYSPRFYIQGSYKTGTSIRNKEDHCDLDDGVYFEKNPDNVSGCTLQNWIIDAVEGTTDATPIHKRKCIRVDYKAGYNIDLPVMVFDKSEMDHPHLATKDSGFKEDDPKEFIEYFKSHKTDQMVRMVKYLKAWCENKRESMPSGLAMTILTLDSYMFNSRDDIALKFLLISIESKLKTTFVCKMPTTPKDDLFEDYSSTKHDNFMANLSEFITDAKKAIDEKNRLRASKLWRKHLGERFPFGEDTDESDTDKESLRAVASQSKPYYE